MADNKSVMDLLAAAAEELQAATRVYEDREREETEARHRATDARTRVNKAQKAFDDVVRGMKGTAPRDTDWRNEERKTYADVVRERKTYAVETP